MACHSVGGCTRSEARSALADGTRGSASFLRDRGFALPSRDVPGEEPPLCDGAGRALGRGAPCIATVAAAALLRRFCRRDARADRARALPARRARLRQDRRALA